MDNLLTTIDYTDYIAENLEKSINYSDYIAGNLNTITIPYPDNYIGEKLDNEINKSGYLTSGLTYSEDYFSPRKDIKESILNNTTNYDDYLLTLSNNQTALSYYQYLDILKLSFEK